MYVCKHKGEGFALTWHPAERTPRARCMAAGFSRLAHSAHWKQCQTWWQGETGGNWKQQHEGANPLVRTHTGHIKCWCQTFNTVPTHQRNALFSAQYQLMDFCDRVYFVSFNKIHEADYYLVILWALVPGRVPAKRFCLLHLKSCNTLGNTFWVNYKMIFNWPEKRAQASKKNQ